MKAKHKVYYNLHKHCLSIMFKGKVLEHSSEFFLKNVDFRVSQAGRSRVLREKRKNVHAFVCGTPDEGWPIHGERQVTYNPYKYKSFVYADTKRPVYKAKWAGVIGREIFVLN
ncbi:hypothetical protein EBU71_13330 [bacterium]|nr:hypothetical protein [Candidatus Elulimicrobium humile]